MTVAELTKFLSACPDDEEVSILYPEDSYGDDTGVVIDEVAYITGTSRVKHGVYIKLG